MAAIPQLEFSISACSRAKRESEVDGKDYYFITVDTFKEKISANEFVEWQQVYPGSYYGTLKRELDRIWSSGKVPIFDVDVQGGLNLKRFFGDQALALFIRPPSIEVLEERLRIRGTETEESIQKRVGKAAEELSYSDRFDQIVVNDLIGKSSAEAIRIVTQFIQ